MVLLPPLLLLCLRLGWGAQGTELPSPSSVWFQALLFKHILHWEPIPSPSPNTSYEVMLQRYGDEHWYLLPNCSRIQAPSCDITLDTMELYYNNGYKAKVRAVDGHRLSNWSQPSPRFTIDKVVLTVGGVKLEMHNGFIHGTIQPSRPPVASIKYTYNSIFKLFRKYQIAVSKPPGNYTVRKVDKEHFSFPAGEVGQLCVKVKPLITSRTNDGLWSQEQCITLSRQYFTVTNISLFLTFVLLLCAGLGCCLVLHLYVRRPGKLPSTLVFTQPSPSVPPSRLPCAELRDAIHPLDEEAVPEPGASGLRGSTDGSFGSNEPALQMEEPPFLLAGPDSPAPKTLGGKGPAELQDSRSNGSGDSTDSGICLQESSLHPSPKPAWRPQRRSAGHSQDDSGVSLVPSSGDPREAQKGPASGPEAPQEEDSAMEAFQGYLKQTRRTDEPAVAEGCPERETFLTDGLSPKLTVCLRAEVGWPPPALAKGYRKQASPRTAGAPREAPAERWSQLAEEWPLLAFASCGDAGAPGCGFTCDLATWDWKAAPGSVLSSFDSDLALPLLSSLHSKEWPGQKEAWSPAPGRPCT